MTQRITYQWRPRLFEENLRSVLPVYLQTPPKLKITLENMEDKGNRTTYLTLQKQQFGGKSECLTLFVLILMPLPLIYVMFVMWLVSFTGLPIKDFHSYPNKELVCPSIENRKERTVSFIFEFVCLQSVLKKRILPKKKLTWVKRMEKEFVSL